MVLFLLLDWVISNPAVPEPALQTISARKRIQSHARAATSYILSQLTDHRKPYKKFWPSEKKHEDRHEMDGNYGTIKKRHQARFTQGINNRVELA